MGDYKFYTYIGYVLSLHHDELERGWKEFDRLGLLGERACVESELSEFDNVYTELCSRLAQASKLLDRPA